MKLNTNWQPMDTAPKDGRYIYIIRHHVSVVGANPKRVELLRVRWLKLAPRFGGEIREYWSEDGKKHLDYADDCYGMTLLTPKLWAEVSEVEVVL